MKVYLDASVIIAAVLSSGGGSSLVLKYISQRLMIGVTSQTVIDEVIEHAQKIKKSKEEIEQFVAECNILVATRITQEQVHPYEGHVDPDDAHVVAGAQLTRCGYLVTLDKKHLLDPTIKDHFAPLQIVSPKELLVIFLAQG